MSRKARVLMEQEGDNYSGGDVYTIARHLYVESLEFKMQLIAELSATKEQLLTS